jgi:hypothetical protein
MKTLLAEVSYRRFSAGVEADILLYSAWLYKALVAVE